MKIPNQITTYCPKCKKHTLQKVREAHEGKRRTMAWGQQKHLLKTKGYTSKVAGQAKRVKQKKKTKLMLECTVCHVKHGRILPDSKKKTEITKGEMTKTKAEMTKSRAETARAREAPKKAPEKR